MKIRSKQLETARPVQRGASTSRRGGAPKDYSDATRGERLQRVMARAGVASRRACEQLIERGQVTVNNTPLAELPAWVDPAHDVIRVDGRIVDTGQGAGGAGRERAHPEFSYLALHKPRDVISTCRDQAGRRCVTDLVELPRGMDHRLFPVGRLDADSTGLLLLTNDGELAYRLTHPRFKIHKQYRVTVRGRLSDEDLDTLRKGLYLTKFPSREVAQKPRPATVSTRAVPTNRASMADVRRIGHLKGSGGAQYTKLMITLTQGQNRQIRRMLARLGFKVGRLKRVALGPVSLNRLSPGQWRSLERREVTALRRAVGLKG